MALIGCCFFVDIRRQTVVLPLQRQPSSLLRYATVITNFVLNDFD